MQIILNARELCETDPTERIQNAVDTVFRHGGGEVAIPEGIGRSERSDSEAM